MHHNDEMEQNDPLPQIEHGTLVALSCNGLYLSPEHIFRDRQKPEAKAFVRGGKQVWEVFRVIKHLGETSKVSFQNVETSTYLSAANHWKFVGHDQDWEQFELDLVNMDLSAPVTFCIRAGSGPKKNHYLAPAASAENSCVYSSERILWRLEIVAVPTIYLGPRSKDRSQALAGSDLADLKGQKNHLNILLKIARAHKDVGFFYVTGHAINLDLFRIIRDTKDPLPWNSWQNDEETDRYGKVGVELAQYRHGNYSINKNGWSQQMKGISNIDSVVKEFYEDMNSLSLDLLHYLALAQQHVTNHPASWRDEFLSEQRFLNMRSLVYHPGPAGAVTTARHTDATWLTLLLQDNVGGLQIMSRDNTFIDVPPLDGAILVNTGNVLQHRSNGHFKAVCHRVVRPEATADRTRYSLMLFYDHEGGSTGGC